MGEKNWKTTAKCKKQATREVCTVWENDILQYDFVHNIRHIIAEILSVFKGTRALLCAS